MEVEFLPDGLGHDALAVGGDHQRLREQPAHLGVLAAGETLQQLGELLIAQGQALLAPFVEKREEALGPRDLGVGAVDLQPVFAGGELHVEGLFDRQKVVLAAAIELMQVAGILVIEGLRGHDGNGGGRAAEAGRLTRASGGLGGWPALAAGSAAPAQAASTRAGLRGAGRRWPPAPAGRMRVWPIDRHEIGVAGPAGHDVGVQMGDAAAGGGAEVEADVEPVGVDRRPAAPPGRG